MSKYDLAEFLFISVAILTALIVGFLLGADALNKELKNCAKQHNVYKCEIQYVPVKGQNDDR